MKTTNLILLLAVLFSTKIFSQTISYDDLQKGGFEFKNGYTSYIAKDKHTYKVGDTLKLGTPSDKNTFKHCTQMTIAGEQIVMNSRYSGSNAIIKKIRITGTKRSGFRINLQTKGNTALDNYFIDFENAVETGEVKSFGYSSDEALTELKKAKDKLELGLITQEEFDKLKEELSKFIK